MNIKTVAIAVMATLGFITSAQASTLVAADHSSMTNLCMTVVSGNRAAMHEQIKSSGYSKAFVVKNVQCNGDNILAFIDKHGKNPANMLKILDRTTTKVSITDIAKNNT